MNLPRFVGTLADKVEARKLKVPHVAYCLRCAQLAGEEDFTGIEDFGLCIGIGEIGLLKKWLNLFHPADHKIRFINNSNGRMGL